MREQLLLFDSREPAEEKDHRGYLGSYRPRHPVQVVFTRNRSTILSVRQRGSSRVLRIHEVFREASEPVWEAVVALYLRGVRRAARREHHAVINRFLKTVEDQIEKGKRKSFRLDRLPGPLGKIYDLRAIFDEVRAAAIPEEVDLFLTWSERVNKRTMGSWHQSPEGYPNVIRVNLLLDDARVPRLYVASVVHHEILHEILGYRVTQGRRIHHSRAFRERERGFPGYDLAEEWATDHLGRIYHNRTRREKRLRVVTARAERKLSGFLR